MDAVEPGQDPAERVPAAARRGPAPGGRRHLILVGMMGAGKTTVGRRVAEALGWPFVDCDDVVEERTGRDVATLFAESGETAFRTAEREVVLDVLASPIPAVVATGGGAVLDEGNRAMMRSTGVVVWLRASPDELQRRVAGGEGRPLLAGLGSDPGAERARLAELSAAREASYHRVAHDVITVEHLTVDEVVATLTDFAREEFCLPASEHSSDRVAGPEAPR